MSTYCPVCNKPADGCQGHAWSEIKDDLKPFERWEIVSDLDGNGVTYTLHGSVFGWPDDGSPIRFVDAIADGLRRAGFNPKVTLTRESVEQR